MIKLIFCLRRLPSLTHDTFLRYWAEQHAPLVRTHAATLRIRRYAQSHGFAEPHTQPVLDARGSKTAPYDGVAELWWDRIEDVLTAGSTPEGRTAGRALLADERRFIDLENSPLFFAREHVVIA